MFIVLSSSLNRWDVFVLRKRLAACLAGVLRQPVVRIHQCFQWVVDWGGITAVGSYRVAILST